MQIAGEVAFNSNDKVIKVGAVLVDLTSSVVSEGYNIVYSNKKIHAEDACIGKSLDLEGYSLYVTLIPCVNCAKLIVNSGISRVVVKSIDESLQDRDPEYRAKWCKRFTESLDILAKANVSVKFLRATTL